MYATYIQYFLYCSIVWGGLAWQVVSCTVCICRRLLVHIHKDVSVEPETAHSIGTDAGSCVFQAFKLYVLFVYMLIDACFSSYPFELHSLRLFCGCSRVRGCVYVRTYGA